jgi:hypothetical protein
MTLETAGALPKTRERRRGPLDLNHLRSWVCVNFLMGMEIVGVGASTLHHQVAAKEKYNNQ